MVLELNWAAVAGNDGRGASRGWSPRCAGPGTLQGSQNSFDAGVVTIALLTHYVLGVVFGTVLAFIIAGFHYETSVLVMQLIGAAFGVLLYLFNFHAVTQVFPWFAELRGWPTLVAHLAFGIAAALLYRQLARRVADSRRAS